MAKEELFLPVEMDKLKIEPGKLNNLTNENPFLNVSSRRDLCLKQHTHLKCFCTLRKKNNSNLTISKRKYKVLREPLLKLLQNCSRSNNVQHGSRESLCKNIVKSSLLQNVNSDNLNLCALVNNCNQLKISSECNERNRISEQNNESKWWKKDLTTIKQWKEPTPDKNRAGPSCSQQALNPPCDITIDELASYFETLVHIPKKMSSMAEMMYI